MFFLCGFASFFQHFLLNVQFGGRFIVFYTSYYTVMLSELVVGYKELTQDPILQTSSDLVASSNGRTSVHYGYSCRRFSLRFACPKYTTQK